MASDSQVWSERPSRAVSLAVSAALVALWAWIRLIAFDTTLFPLTYALPLFVCVWTRDRLALWGMAVIFIAMQSVRIFVLEPPGTYTTHGLTANTIGTVLSIGIAAMAIQAIIHLRERLEAALANVNAQAAELRGQGDALAQQNAALEQQTEALSAQGAALADQNEALQSQSKEIAGLNSVLERRERLLETLLETARVSGTEGSALQHIANAAVELFPDLNVIAAVYEDTDDGLALRALAPSTPDTPLPDPRSTANPPFVRLMMREQRTAALNDSHRRSDLEMPFFLGQPPMRAIIAAAIRSGDAVFGACAICLPHPHEWTDVEFRVTEWLADQCGRVLQALRVQSDLREADRQKNEFLATLSHELRNPLAPIRFALEVMAQGADRGDAVKIINRQFQHLARLVDDLLDATRLSRNVIQVRKTRVDLVPILRSAIEAIRPDVESASHTLAVTLPAEPVFLDADADRLAQVVTNLVNNAAKYTPAGGRITVLVERARNEAVITVADTGVGLSPADLRRVFDMFTQVGGPGSGGLGLGLAIVRRIVELHGGHVEARSAGEGRGSEFTVRLPVAAPGEQAASATAAAPQVNKRRRVLVVDDNRDAASMMAMLLELHGHDVLVAHDAERALETARANTLDVALLDIGLPGVDGYELARRLRQQDGTRHLRLIAVTGWGQAGDRARASEAGFNAHLTKPTEPELLLSALNA